jgi:hypothetical protein
VFTSSGLFYIKGSPWPCKDYNWIHIYMIMQSLHINTNRVNHLALEGGICPPFENCRIRLIISASHRSRLFYHKIYITRNQAPTPPSPQQKKLKVDWSFLNVIWVWFPPMTRCIRYNFYVTRRYDRSMILSCSSTAYTPPKQKLTHHEITESGIKH